MPSFIVSADIREFSIDELWSTLGDLIADRGTTLNAVLDAAKFDGRQYSGRGRTHPGSLRLNDVRRLFRAVGYKLSLTAAAIPTNPLSEGNQDNGAL